MKYEIKISKSIKEVDKIKWDELNDFCFLKSDFLDIIENLTLGKDPYYVEIFEDDKLEKLSAIAVFYGQSTTSLYSNLEEALYGKYSALVKPFLGLNPSLLCHFPYSPFYEMFKIRDNKNKIELFNLISETLKSLSEKGDYKSYGFLGIETEELVENSNSSNLLNFFSGFKIRILINGTNFEEHVAASKKSHRHTIRKDKTRFINSEFDVERIKKLGNHKKDILNIFDENLLKYGSIKKNESELSKEFIESLDSKSNNITFFLGKLKNNIVSTLMVVEDELRLVGLRVGQAQSVSGEGYPFYNVAIYEPISYGAQNSKKTLELGTGSYTYKTRRGANLHDSHFLINSNSNFKNIYLKYIIKILSNRNRKKHLNRIK